MEKVKAVWHGLPFFDTSIRKWLVTFECDKPPIAFDKTKDKPLAITIKQWREGRSLNANAYFHVLVEKIAETLGVSHYEIHNRMIAEYGYKDNTIPEVILREDIPWEKLEAIHLRPRAEFDFIEEELYQKYDVMRGSHTYDTQEMARLIDGVVFEAESLGIETMTPDEIERMKSLWNQ